LLVLPLLITTFTLTPLTGELEVLTSRMAAASQQTLYADELGHCEQAVPMKLLGSVFGHGLGELGEGTGDE
jgi:hypothetical protein